MMETQTVDRPQSILLQLPANKQIRNVNSSVSLSTFCQWHLVSVERNENLHILVQNHHLVSLHPFFI